MENFLIYLGKVSVAVAAFFLIYLLLYRSQKQFRFNRFFLLGAFGVSFFLPLLTFTVVRTVFQPAVMLPANDEAVVQQVAILSETDSFRYEKVLFVIYWMGGFFFMLRLLAGNLKAFSIVRKSRIEILLGKTVSISEADIHPFTFFGRVVMARETLSHPSLALILQHESVHVDEKHTFDILLSELLFLLQWYNPFAWLIRDAIKNNLEFRADQQVVRGGNMQAYQLAMVSLADKKGVTPFLTALNGNDLKNRIIMMKKKTENRYTLVKQLAVLPLLAILTMGLANREVKFETISSPAERLTQLSGTQQEKVIRGRVTDENGVSLSGAAVVIKGKTIGTITDSKGNYQIAVGEGEELVFSFPGKEKTTILARQDEINVQLKPLTPAAPGEKELRGKISPELAVKVSGKITNDKGEPLSSVAVLIKGTTMGTISDHQGNYLIQVPDKEAVLLFTLPGLQQVVETVGDRTQIDAKLLPLKSGSLSPSNPENKKSEEENIPSPKAKSQVVKGFSVANKKGDESASVSFINVESEKKAVGNVELTPQDKNGITIRSEGDPSMQLLYIVDGEKVKKIDHLLPGDILTVNVLKGASATGLYGDEAKNGAVVIQTKKAQDRTSEIAGDPLIILDGKAYDGKLDDIPAGDIAGVNVIKEVPLTRIYGEKAENGVVIINTKTKYNTNMTEQAVEKSNPSAANTTGYALRKAIASKIRYPVVAMQNNVQGTVVLWAVIESDGKITRFFEEKPNWNVIDLEEVVVVGAMTAKQGSSLGKGAVDDKVASGNPSGTAGQSPAKLISTLSDEVKRVLIQCQPIEVPELKGKIAAFRVKFIIQQP